MARVGIGQQQTMQTDHDIEQRVQLSRVLRSRIENPDLRLTRKYICDELGISKATLSNYEHGRSLPTLHNLIRLASLLNESLDFVVFGEGHLEREPASAQPWVEQFQSYFADSRLAEEKTREVSERILSQIAREVRALSERVVAEAGARNAPVLPGFLTDEESLLLERNSVETWILSMNFFYEIQVRPDGDVPGRFAPVIAENLSRGRKYKHLLPKGAADWPDLVHRFRKLLRTFNLSKAELDCAEFRVSANHLINGMGILHLDMDALSGSLEGRVYTERNADFIDDHRRFGYTIASTTRPQCDVVMDVGHLGNAAAAFERLWETARPV